MGWGGQSEGDTQRQEGEVKVMEAGLGTVGGEDRKRLEGGKGVTNKVRDQMADVVQGEGSCLREHIRTRNRRRRGRLDRKSTSSCQLLLLMNQL